MSVAEEGAVVGGVGLVGQPQKQHLGKSQSERKLLPDLPDAVQQQQEEGGFLLDPGVGVGGVSAALLERVSCLEKTRLKKQQKKHFTSTSLGKRCKNPRQRRAVDRKWHFLFWGKTSIER